MNFDRDDKGAFAPYATIMLRMEVATHLATVMYWLLFVVAGGGDGAFATIWYFYLPCFVYTAVMTMALNLALIMVKKKLNKELINE